MKKRAYISGFDSNIVLHLKKFMDVRVWMHDEAGCTHHVGKLTSLDFPIESLPASPVDRDCYHNVYGSLPVFIDIYSRSFPYYEKSYHGLLNAFNLLFGYCYRLLTSERIEYVVFANIPHEAVDFIVERIARYLKLPVLMCHQSPFPDRFWVLRDLNDFGRFAEIPELSSNEHYRLEREFNWFYMQTGDYQYGAKKLLKDILVAPLSFPYAFYKYKKAFDFRRNLERRIAPNISLDCKYVYFPLHLQPELTTSALGGIYSDQLLALERLDEVLPADWLIYVKENPKQTDMQRDAEFFQRLEMLRNVRIVPMATNSLELIRASQFVATITGTAGWEAISLGKKTLVFGLPWYRYLPGVFRFDAGFSIDTLCAAETADPLVLEAAVRKLLGKAAEGVVDPLYCVLVEAYANEKNALKVARAVEVLVCSDEA
ncbi:hypothetical protein [Herbaspirillum lusitanum]|uniref:capsular polysaccharide export protein, LipB/KpsS family n=1 Tax=Herbaspirillum lusitanum TaxID=213312 RepID=UPI0003668709|nr:hypothetical protein [Herbaspirillum lusitanum]